MSNQTTLIADIGGTNARFAISAANPPYYCNALTLQCCDHPTLLDAIDTYLSQHHKEQPDALCFAVAGAVKDETMSFLNNNWSLSAQELRERYHTKQVKLLNDFESVSYCLPQLSSADLLVIGDGIQGKQHNNYCVGVIGPGSGLGVAGLIVKNGYPQPIAGEGGHAGFAPDSLEQAQILEYLQSKFRRVSNERLLSGPGLVNIHEALCAINKVDNPGLGPADIAVAAREQNDPLCEQTMKLFFEILGQVAGDTALTLGAFDGIYIGGGIAQRYPNQLLRSAFRTGFENKGRYQAMMKTIPTWLITHSNPGLLGASVYANKFLEEKK